MKTVMVATIIILTQMVGFAEGLLLKEGDSHTIEFASLPDAGPSLNSDAVYLSVTFAPSASNDFRKLQLELIPNDFTKTPLSSSLQVRPPSVGQLALTAVWVSGSEMFWPERSGSARVKMLNGELEIVSIAIKLIHDGRLYSLSFSVTETPPSIFISKVGENSVRLAWPTSASAYKLESTTNWVSPVWLDLTNTATIEGTNFSVTVENNTPQRFFRLHTQ